MRSAGMLRIMGQEADTRCRGAARPINWSSMPEEDDPFPGTWRFNAELSKPLGAESPQSWVQRIVATPDEIQVCETIIRSDCSETVVSVRAKFDGKDYPVSGSPVADTISYTRTDRNSISGRGKKNGVVAVAPDSRTLTLSYSIYQGPRVAANGIAVFEKDM